MSRFVKAEPGPRNSVIYTDDEGKRFMYSGGDRTWRNQNPGDLVPGEVSKRNQQIGTAGGFAVFPDYMTGHKALLDSLNSTYGDKGLSQMIEAFAPRHENQTNKYLHFLRKQTGVKDDRKIKNFTSAEFEKLWRVIELM